MSRRAVGFYRFLTILFVVAAVAMTGLFFHERSKTEVARDRVDELNSLCRVSRTKIAHAATLIRANDDTKAQTLQRLQDEYIALSVCPTKRFDFDAWTSCLAKSDESCLVKMLDEVSRNIDHATQREVP